MFPVYYIPVFIALLQTSQVWSVDSKLLGYNQILEIDLNTLKRLLDAEKLGDSLKRSSVDSGPTASLPGNTVIQSPVSLPSNTQYSSLPMPLYFRKPNPVKKSVCDNVHGNSQYKAHRTPLAAASSTITSTHYGLSSAPALPKSSSPSVPSVGQKIEIARNRYSALSRTLTDSAAKPAKSNQTSSSTTSPVPTEHAKSTEIDSAESLSNAAYTAVSPNSHLAIAAPTSASGYDAGNMQALGQGASIAKLPGLKPLAIEEHQKAAFHDFTGALENHEFKPLTHQDVQNLPVVSHSALTGGAVSTPQSQGGYSNQGNTNYGANPNQGFMQQFNGYAGAGAPTSYNEGPVINSNNGLSGAQSYGGQHYGGANSAPSYGASFNAPNTQSYGGMPNAGQFYNNVQSGVSQSYGYPSGSFENSNNQGWNSPLRAFIR